MVLSLASGLGVDRRASVRKRSRFLSTTANRRLAACPPWGSCGGVSVGQNGGLYEQNQGPTNLIEGDLGNLNVVGDGLGCQRLSRLHVKHQDGLFVSVQ